MAPQETRTIKVFLDGVQITNPAANNITFSSSDTSKATVSTAGTVTAVEVGNITITVTKTDNGNSTTIATVPVTVGG